LEVLRRVSYCELAFDVIQNKRAIIDQTRTFPINDRAHKTIIVQLLRESELRNGKECDFG